MGIKFSSDDFVSQAIKKTGLDDFGGNAFKTGMGALIDSLNTDLDLSDVTAGYFHNQILQLLMNRLEVTQLLKRHPEISDEEIEAPVFIVGLPRSGTTILQTLLALDPASRYLRNFEATGPVLPPSELIPDVLDPRIQACHEGMEGLFAAAPGLRGINGINFMAQGSAECQNLMAHDFVHMGWSAGSSLFSHGNWVGDCNMKTAYEWHKRLLQILQWKMPNERWLLKAPIHLFGLEELIRNYPDARIIFTHRNPFDAMVSGVSMVTHWTRFTTGQADIEAIADWYPKLWVKGLKRALKTIEKLTSDQLIHVFHRDLTTAPITEIEKIYGHFDIWFTTGARKRMQTWLRDHPRSRFGSHDYASEDFCLRADRERERFGFYVDQFSV